MTVGLIKSLRHGRHDAGTDQGVRERRDVGLDSFLIIYMIIVSALDTNQWTQNVKKTSSSQNNDNAATVRRAYCSM